MSPHPAALLKSSEPIPKHWRCMPFPRLASIPVLSSAGRLNKANTYTSVSAPMPTCSHWSLKHSAKSPWLNSRSSSKILPYSTMSPSWSSSRACTNVHAVILVSLGYLACVLMDLQGSQHGAHGPSPGPTHTECRLGLTRPAVQCQGLSETWQMPPNLLTPKSLV